MTKQPNKKIADEKLEEMHINEETCMFAHSGMNYTVTQIRSQNVFAKDL